MYGKYGQNGYMNENVRVLALTQQWVKKKGKRAALQALVGGGVSVPVADKIVGHRYPSIPREDLAEKLIAVIAKDGFKLTGKKAS